MYIVDTNSFNVLGHYYPENFPSLWNHIDLLIKNTKFASVKEVKRELELNFHSEHLESWVKNNSKIFFPPSVDEMILVSEIFMDSTFRNLVKRNNILRGLPVADPFLVAAAKHKKASVITEEKYKKNAARIPNVCEKFKVPCINIQTFLKIEKIKF